MKKCQRIAIPTDLFEAIEAHLDELGATSVEEYVEAVLRSQLQQAGHVDPYSSEEREEIERRLRDLGYLD